MSLPADLAARPAQRRLASARTAPAAGAAAAPWLADRTLRTVRSANCRLAVSVLSAWLSMLTTLGSGIQARAGVESSGENTWRSKGIDWTGLRRTQLPDASGDLHGSVLTGEHHENGRQRIAASRRHL